MSRFPTAGHLVSWAKLVTPHHPVRGQEHAGQDWKGNPYLKGALGEAAAAAARTDTFLGERYRRIVRRRGKLRALVAVARSILVIVWHLLVPTPPPASANSAPAITPAAPTPAARPATTSASSKRSGSPSPWPTPPDSPPRITPPPGCPLALRRVAAARSGWSALFSGQRSAVRARLAPLFFVHVFDEK